MSSVARLRPPGTFICCIAQQTRSCSVGNVRFGVLPFGSISILVKYRTMKPKTSQSQHLGRIIAWRMILVLHRASVPESQDESQCHKSHCSHWISGIRARLPGQVKPRSLCRRELYFGKTGSRTRMHPLLIPPSHRRSSQPSRRRRVELR